MSAALAPEELYRIDRLFAVAIENPGVFGDFHVDFVMRNVERLDRYQAATRFSDKQMAVIDAIEARANEEGLL